MSHIIRKTIVAIILIDLVGKVALNNEHNI